MIIVFAVVGIVLGAAVANFAGAIAGAALGFAIGSHLTVRRRIDRLEERLDRVSSRPFVTPERTVTERTVAAPEASIRREPVVREVAPARMPSYADRPFSAPPAAEERQPQAVAPEYPAIVAWIRDYFTGGNVVVRTGIIILFIGVAFLLKFAADRDMMPIELRLSGVALGGAAMLVIGWRLRERQRAYALALQGGGVGLLYLTVFASLRLYALLPPTAAFGLLVAVAGLSAFLAIGQNSMAMAALGVTGGFLAPVLASTGQGNHVVLFSYYAFLNAGIVAIAWFKAWRPLNVLAFVFTFGIGSAWGVLRYTPENFATTEPFLALFFAMFVTIAVLFALRSAPRLGNYVDGTLVFGTPVVTMVLQSAMVHDRPYAMAFSALTLSAAYLLLAFGIWRGRRAELSLLASAFLALGVAFLTLAVPLALDGHWTAATWALEGAAILWIGLRQDRRLAMVSGVLLQLGAAVSFVARHDVIPPKVPLVNSEFLGALFIALGGLATARVLFLHRGRMAERFHFLATPPVYWALAWWFIAGAGEIHRFAPPSQVWPELLGLATLTSLGCAALTRWKDWREMRPPVVLLLPAMAITAVAMAYSDHLLAAGGVIAWPAAVAAWIWLLRWRHRNGRSAADVPIHILGLWLAVALVSFELAWQMENARLGAAAWHIVMRALPSAAALALIVSAARHARWPVVAYPEAYARNGAAILAGYLWLWSIGANVFDGGAAPLPYLPLVNPIELTQGIVLASVFGWLLYLHRDAPADWRGNEVVRFTWPAFAFAVFALLTTVLLRTLHHYAGVAYEIGALMHSTIVQAALSIFWGVLALTAMVFGARRDGRFVWFGGAVLLGVVLAKMFLVDLSRTGTVARIVSFIGVGVLMLIIGRFSPVPPATRLAAEGVK